MKYVWVLMYETDFPGGYREYISDIYSTSDAAEDQMVALQSRFNNEPDYNSTRYHVEKWVLHDATG